MTIPLAGAPAPLCSYKDSTAPSLILEKRNGEMLCWPLHMLSHWVYTGPCGETMKIVSTNGDTALLCGANLNEIFEALASGKGGKIIEHEERYAPIATLEGHRAWVDQMTLTVSEGLR